MACEYIIIAISLSITTNSIQDDIIRDNHDLISNCTTFYNSIAVYNYTLTSCNVTEEVHQECLLFKSEIKWQITIAVFGFITILFQVLPMMLCRENLQQQEIKVQSFVSGFFVQPFVNKIQILKRTIFGGNNTLKAIKDVSEVSSEVSSEEKNQRKGLSKKQKKAIWFLLRKLICSSITIEIASEALDMTYRTDKNFDDKRPDVTNFSDLWK